MNLESFKNQCKTGYQTIYKKRDGLNTFECNSNYCIPGYKKDQNEQCIQCNNLNVTEKWQGNDVPPSDVNLDHHYQQQIINKIDQSGTATSTQIKDEIKRKYQEVTGNTLSSSDSNISSNDKPTLITKYADLMKTVNTSRYSNDCKALTCKTGNTKSSGGLCLDTCIPGYRKVNNRCKAFEGSCANGTLITPQSSRTQDNHCGTCNNGYYLDNKICKPYKYLFIVMTKNQHINLRYIEVLDNNRATISYNDSDIQVIDEHGSGNYPKGNLRVDNNDIYHSQTSGPNAYIRIRFPESVNIGKIIVKNRNDGWKDRIENGKIYLSKSPNKADLSNNSYVIAQDTFVGVKDIYTFNVTSRMMCHCENGNLGSNCQKSGSDCRTCNNGYDLSSNVCRPFAGTCNNGNLIGQSSRDKENHCGSCNIGYGLNNKNCVRCNDDEFQPSNNHTGQCQNCPAHKIHKTDMTGCRWKHKYLFIVGNGTQVINLNNIEVLDSNNQTIPYTDSDIKTYDQSTPNGYGKSNLISDNPDDWTKMYHSLATPLINKTEAYIRIALPYDADITTVIVRNRVNCCKVRIVNAKIYLTYSGDKADLTNSNKNTYVIAEDTFDGEKDEYIFFTNIIFHEPPLTVKNSWEKVARFEGSDQLDLIDIQSVEMCTRTDFLNVNDKFIIDKDEIKKIRILSKEYVKWAGGWGWIEGDYRWYPDLLKAPSHVATATALTASQKTTAQTLYPGCFRNLDNKDVFLSRNHNGEWTFFWPNSHGYNISTGPMSSTFKGPELTTKLNELSAHILFERQTSGTDELLFKVYKKTAHLQGGGSNKNDILSKYISFYIRHKNNYIEAKLSHTGYKHNKTKADHIFTNNIGSRFITRSDNPYTVGRLKFKVNRPVKRYEFDEVYYIYNNVNNYFMQDDRSSENSSGRLRPHGVSGGWHRNDYRRENYTFKFKIIPAHKTYSYTGTDNFIKRYVGKPLYYIASVFNFDDKDIIHSYIKRPANAWANALTCNPRSNGTQIPSDRAEFLIEKRVDSPSTPPYKYNILVNANGVLYTITQWPATTDPFKSDVTWSQSRADANYNGGRGWSTYTIKSIYHDHKVASCGAGGLKVDKKDMIIGTDTAKIGKSSCKKCGPGKTLVEDMYVGCFSNGLTQKAGSTIPLFNSHTSRLNTTGNSHAYRHHGNKNFQQCRDLAKAYGHRYFMLENQDGNRGTSETGDWNSECYSIDSKPFLNLFQMGNDSSCAIDNSLGVGNRTGGSGIMAIYDLEKKSCKDCSSNGGANCVKTLKAGSVDVCPSGYEPVYNEEDCQAIGEAGLSKKNNYVGFRRAENSSAYIGGCSIVHWKASGDGDRLRTFYNRNTGSNKDNILHSKVCKYTGWEKREKQKYEIGKHARYSTSYNTLDDAKQAFENKRNGGEFVSGIVYYNGAYWLTRNDPNWGAPYDYDIDSSNATVWKNIEHNNNTFVTNSR